MDDNVKLIMNWDIQPEKDQEYFEFVVREWVPGITRLGIETTGAWLTVYSRDEDMPRIMAEGVTETLEEAQRILKSQQWLSLHDRLMEYVENYSQKVVRVNGEFQF